MCVTAAFGVSTALLPAVSSLGLVTAQTVQATGLWRVKTRAILGLMWLNFLRFVFVQRSLAVVVLLMTSAPSVAGGFEQRLAAVETTVEGYLAAKQSVEPYPKTWRKILWFRLQGDVQPDALVVLRPGQNECGAAALSSRPCRALLLVGLPDGSYRVATEFSLLIHPIALLLDGRGQVAELLYSRDMQAVPSYTRFRWDGQEFQRVEGALDSAQMRQLPTLVADDRNMSLLEDQRYAGRNFNNTNAWLAPFRLHYDTIAVASQEVAGLDVAKVNLLAVNSIDRLMPMMQETTKAFPWSQTLEVRLWSCVDWMVPRRFWEVEGQRLGRLGTCIEPAAIVQALNRDQEAILGVLKQQLTQQMGMAFLMRTAPLPAAERETLRRAGSDSVFKAAVAGMQMGHVTKTHSLEQAADSIQLLRLVADVWFEQIEKKRSYSSPTPELRAFVSDVSEMEQANQCLRTALKMAASKALQDDACSKDRLEKARAIAELVQRMYRP